MSESEAIKNQEKQRIIAIGVVKRVKKLQNKRGERQQKKTCKTEL